MAIRKFIRKENGSITLEAAMILPLFMLFIVFLATLIRLAVADMALYKAASETTELVVSYAYPADIAKSSVTSIIDDKIKSIENENQIDITGAIEWANEGLQFFGIDIAASVENLFEGLAASAVEPILEDKFKQATGNWNFFKPENLHVTKVELPSLAFGSGRYLEIDVEYVFDITIPFVDKTIVLKKTAYERLWNGS
ncbi:pilus assembly protein [Ornithinibacillus gellani]|uniref:TadE/TadG family type IV pilus assembly protein n=1 Tax=Ornithinibacillus gellani TaxID=2293253 RepID=UPI000F46E30F|nr:TadE family protein [Ornithinibacillus gellani]TQS74627.1 pilus assembly protein [Ornithinibacillus gellani]